MTNALATFDATLRDLVDDGQPIAPDCPYCDKPISGDTRQYGGGLMHRKCYDAFGEDLETAFPDDLAPIHPQRFTGFAFDPDWVQPEWETTQLLEQAEAEARYEMDHAEPFPELDDDNVPF